MLIVLAALNLYVQFPSFAARFYQQSMALNLSKVKTRPLQSSLSKCNITILENHGLDGRTGFWWFKFTFDHGLEKGIEVRLTNFKYGGENLGKVWTLEVVKCQYLSIESESDMASFDMEDDLINANELSRLMEVSTSREKFHQYLETNIIPLVTKKIKYTRFKPQFQFFLSHKSKDKPLMRTFANGLKFLGYETWLDQVDMPMGATLEGALKTSVENCDCIIAWLNEEYMSSDWCRAELLYAKELGKIVIPFGVYGDLKEHMSGDFEFLHSLFVYNPKSSSFFEILRRIDDSLFNFENLAA